MENKDFDIEVNSAFLATREAITEVQTFVLQTESSYGTTVSQTYYLGPKGWKQANSYSWGGEKIAYTQEEANQYKKEMMASHLEYLKKNKKETEDQITTLEVELGK